VVKAGAGRAGARLALAWTTIVVCVLGWPVSAFTFARGEPPVILALSWVSPILTAMNLLLTVSVRNTQDEDNA
jgi:cation transporter-like permease